MKSIYKVGIIGGGTMGADLTAMGIRSDMPVVAKELNDELAERLKIQLDQRIDGWLQKGKISESRAEQLKMLFTVTSTYDDMLDVDLVIEAVPEIKELKIEIFCEVGELLPDALLTSNTSGIPIIQLSEEVRNPERMAGMHFFNPPTQMQLVELIPSKLTSPETIESLKIFSAETLAKKPIQVKDRTGFLMNVLLGAYLVPAIRALENTDVKKEEIDALAGKDGFGFPMGPFVLLDRMGLKVVKDVLTNFSAAYGERFSPSRLVDILVNMGRLGDKTGAGFYGGTEPLESIVEREFPNRAKGYAEHTFWLMKCGMINEAALALQDGVASSNDIETGWLFGLGFPQAKGGPLHYADEIGAETIVRELGDDACPLLQEMATSGKTFFSSW